MTFPRAPSKEKGAFVLRSLSCMFFHVHVFLHDFFGDDVTRFPCGYIYIYIILYNACRQHGFMLKGSKCFTHDLS